MSPHSSAGEAEVEVRMGGPRTPLAGGRWSAEVRGDEVANICYDGVLLLRAVRPVVRDADWNTVPVRVLDHRRATGSDAGLEIDLRFETVGVAYAATVTVDLAEEVLSIDFQGRAETSFHRNRIGLVVLHPPGVAGRPVTVTHPDGATTAGRWPVAISPHQPFREVAGFRWSASGAAADLTLSGDVFETEDQRNWTDASFKTYSTPLSLPFPVRISAGETCRQQVVLRATGQRTSPPADHTETVTISPTVMADVPPMSLGAALYPPPAERLLAESIGPRGAYETVLVELTGPEEQWPELLATAHRQAAALAAKLDVRVVTADPAAVDRALGLLATLPVHRLAVFDPTSHLSAGPLWAALRDGAGRRGLSASLVGGTRAHFTELNRQLEQIPADVPALTFGLTPQMHATEVPHLVDSLTAQRTVAENAVRLAAGRPLHVGPVTLARRFNAVATTTRAGPAAEAAAATDALQGTHFAAAWTLGSVAALAVPGVASLCYYETAGVRGLAAGDHSRTPAGLLLDRLATWRGRPILRVHRPGDLAALAVAGADRLLLALANLTPTSRTVHVRSPRGHAESVELSGWAHTFLELD